MSDITKCLNDNCPLADTCYRKLANDSNWQSVARFEYKEIDGEIVCEWYWETKQTKKDE